MFNNNNTTTIHDMPRSIEEIEQELRDAKVERRRQALFDRYELNKQELTKALNDGDDERAYKLSTAFVQRFRNLHKKSDSTE